MARLISTAQAAAWEMAASRFDLESELEGLDCTPVDSEQSVRPRSLSPEALDGWTGCSLSPGRFQLPSSRSSSPCFSSDSSDEIVSAASGLDALVVQEAGAVAGRGALPPGSMDDDEDEAALGGWPHACEDYHPGSQRAALGVTAQGSGRSCHSGAITFGAAGLSHAVVASGASAVASSSPAIGRNPRCPSDGTLFTMSGASEKLSKRARRGETSASSVGGATPTGQWAERSAAGEQVARMQISSRNTSTSMDAPASFVSTISTGGRCTRKVHPSCSATTTADASAAAPSSAAASSSCGVSGAAGVWEGPEREEDDALLTTEMRGNSKATRPSGNGYAGIVPQDGSGGSSMAGSSRDRVGNNSLRRCINKVAGMPRAALKKIFPK